MITLQATSRLSTGKLARKEAKENATVPAVVYGPKQEAMHVSISLPEFQKVLRHGAQSSLIELQGLSKPLHVLIQDIDHDPVTSVPRHADFYAVEKGAKVEVAIPLSFVGESAAVKAGANLVKVLHEIEVETDPANMPHEIEVDISVLAEEGDQIHVRDLKIPAGIELKMDEDEVVALVQAVAVEVEEPSVGPDMDSIEVEKKGKEDDGESTDESA